MIDCKVFVLAVDGLGLIKRAYEKQFDTYTVNFCSLCPAESAKDSVLLLCDHRPLPRCWCVENLKRLPDVYTERI